MDTALELDTRNGLPDALRVLLQDYPRHTWDMHDNFAGLVAFWLDRHLMFRKLTTALLDDAEAAIDGKIDARSHAGKLSRYGGMLLQNLHGHHQIEDHHYFPLLSKREKTLTRGFALLDADHHAMDGLLDRFAKGANGVIQGQIEPGHFRNELLGFQNMLDRHLIDEEELVVPVILKYGPQGLS
jgi:iron-sulfur cluster repair protein YtfE (RIC family)